MPTDSTPLSLNQALHAYRLAAFTAGQLGCGQRTTGAVASRAVQKLSDALATKSVGAALEAYWNFVFAEGQRAATSDTADGAAQRAVNP